MIRLLRDTPGSSSDRRGHEHALPLRVEAIRAALGPDTVLVEYFHARDQLIAAVVSEAESLEVVPLCSRSRVDPLVRLLEFQFSKFRLGADYAGVFASAMLRATRTHLRELYGSLIEPIRRHLQGRHLVFVPHESLHQLPLHALFDGSQYLIDAYTVSYAPSASVYALCRQQRVNTEGASLILGVPDALAPLIRRGGCGGCRNASRARTVPGRERQPTCLRDRGAASRVIHIATHGTVSRR